MKLKSSLVEDNDLFILLDNNMAVDGNARRQGITGHSSDLAVPEYSGCSPWASIH